VDIGHGHVARFDLVVTLNQRTHHELPEFLLSEWKVRVIDRVVGFDLSQHLNERFRAYLHVSAPRCRLGPAASSYVIQHV
jgi:reverse gyrase